MADSPSPIALLIFDLDGTLIDSRGDITASVNYALERLQLPPLSVEKITAFVGRGVSNLIRSVLGENHRELFKKAITLFRKHYSEHLLDKTMLYPDVQTLLESLNGILKAVITNKPVDYSSRILKGLKVHHYFAEIMGGDTGNPKKPSPDALLKLMQKFHVRPDQTMIVGDSTIDIEAGKNACVRTCAVSYGFGIKEDLIQAKPDYLLDRLIDLRSVVYPVSH